jgi:anti-anti-sigma factor
MDIRTRLDGDEMRIELQGRLDAAWSDTVGKALQDALRTGCHSVALDLSGVGYVSSAGIRVLMVLAKQLKAIGGQLRVIDPSPPVRDVLNLVGFHHLIGQGGPSAAPAKPAAAATAATSTATAAATPPPRTTTTATNAAPNAPRTWRHAGHAFEVYDLDPAAVQKGALVGPAEGVFTAGLAGLKPTQLRIAAQTLALGLGALGGGEDCAARSGELLAVDGLAIALPGDDPAHPDWLARQGDLVPEASLFHGLYAEGPFRHLMRFGAAPDAPPLTLSDLALAALELCQAKAVTVAAVAETAGLVGAALQAAPAAGDWFAFPGIRDRLLFTAGAAHADEACLLVGVVARDPVPPLAHWLRIMDPGRNLYAHVHAAALPYRPIHKGRISLNQALEALLEGQAVRGVLHLLNDDRAGVGAGESHLRRGALWCAPARFDGGIPA